MVINKEYILEISRGLYKFQVTEKRKLEFKRKWYDLSGNTPRDEEEFCKDITAMANTPGPEGSIIIGLDEKKGDLTNSPVSNSGLADSQITNLIIKRVRPTIQFEIDTVAIDKDTVITLIKVPPSLEKPHVMGVYRTYDKKNKPSGQRENFIPIRYGASIFPANHTDLEYMYYDRKNVVHDYDIKILPLDNRFAINVGKKHHDQYITITIRYLIQNTGMHPIAINNVKLQIIETSPIISLLHTDPFNLIGDEWAVLERNLNARNYNLSLSPIIIPYNQLSEIQMKFWLEYHTKNSLENNFDQWLRQFREITHSKYTLFFESINGRAFTSDTFEF